MPIITIILSGWTNSRERGSSQQETERGRNVPPGLTKTILKFSSPKVCAGSSSKQGEAGTRPEDQIKLLVHRPREVSQYQKIIPGGVPRH